MIVSLWRKMTLTVYVRIIIEVYLVLLLSSLFEIRYYISDHKGRKYSYIFALVLAISLFLLIILTMIIWKSYNKTPQVKQNHYFRELFSGLKEDSHQNIRSSSSIAPRHSIDAERRKKVSLKTRKARLFTPIFLLRRLVMVLCIITFMTFSSQIIKVSIHSGIQFVYTIFLIVIMPFDCFKDNLTMMINEFVYFILLLYFIYFNQPSKWNLIAETAFIGTIIANNVILCLISLID